MWWWLLAACNVQTGVRGYIPPATDTGTDTAYYMDGPCEGNMSRRRDDTVFQADFDVATRTTNDCFLFDDVFEPVAGAVPVADVEWVLVTSSMLNDPTTPDLGTDSASMTPGTITDNGDSLQVSHLNGANTTGDGWREGSLWYVTDTGGRTIPTEPIVVFPFRITQDASALTGGYANQMFTLGVGRWTASGSNNSQVAGPMFTENGGGGGASGRPTFAASNATSELRLAWSGGPASAFSSPTYGVVTGYPRPSNWAGAFSSGLFDDPAQSFGAARGFSGGVAVTATTQLAVSLNQPRPPSSGIRGNANVAKAQMEFGGTSTTVGVGIDPDALTWSTLTAADFSVEAPAKGYGITIVDTTNDHLLITATSGTASNGIIHAQIYSVTPALEAALTRDGTQAILFRITTDTDPATLANSLTVLAGTYDEGAVDPEDRGSIAGPQFNTAGTVGQNAWTTGGTAGAATVVVWSADVTTVITCVPLGANQTGTGTRGNVPAASAGTFDAAGLVQPLTGQARELTGALGIAVGFRPFGAVSARVKIEWAVVTVIDGSVYNP